MVVYTGLSNIRQIALITWGGAITVPESYLEILCVNPVMIHQSHRDLRGSFAKIDAVGITHVGRTL